MSIVFFDDVLDALGRRVNYEAIVNYAGNAFCEKSWELIQQSNPFQMASDKKSGHGSIAGKLADFFGKAEFAEVRPQKSYTERLKEKKDGKDQADARDAL